MSSYLQKSEIAPLQPYMSDISGIANAFQTKQSYWMQGAAQVKSAYMRNLNMDLTRDDTASELGEFMKGARSEILKLAQTDLSIADNQVRALGVFDPLTNGKTEFSKRILSDASFTRNFRNEMGRAEADRNREGGKDYNEDAVRALSVIRERYRQDKDPMNWQKYSNAVRYSAYYDDASEIREAMKNFRPSSNKSYTSNADGSAIIYKTDKSEYSSEIAAYLNATLSDKAKNSLRTKAIAQFGMFPDQFRGQMLNAYTNDLNLYEKTLNELELDIKAEGSNKDPNRLKQLEQQRELLRNTVNYTARRIQDFTDEKSFKEREFEHMYKVYMNEYVSEKAKGFARENIEYEFKPNEIYKWKLDDSTKRYTANLSSQTDIYLQQLRNQSAKELKQMEIAAELEKAERAGTTADGVNRTTGPVNLNTTEPNMLNNQIVDAENAATQSLRALISSDESFRKMYNDVLTNPNVTPERVNEVTAAIVKNQLEKKNQLIKEYEAIKPNDPLMKQIKGAAAVNNRTPLEEYLYSKGKNIGFQYNAFTDYTKKAEIHQGYINGKNAVINALDEKVLNSLTRSEYKLASGLQSVKLTNSEMKSVIKGDSKDLVIEYTDVETGNKRKLTPEQNKAFMKAYKGYILEDDVSEGYYRSVSEAIGLKYKKGDKIPKHTIHVYVKGKPVSLQGSIFDKDILSNYITAAKPYLNDKGLTVTANGLPVTNKVEFEQLEKQIKATDFASVKKSDVVITSIYYDKDGKLWYKTPTSEKPKVSTVVANPELSKRFSENDSRIVPEMRSILAELNAQTYVSNNNVALIEVPTAIRNINGINFKINLITTPNQEPQYSFEYYDNRTGKYQKYDRSVLSTPIELQQAISDISSTY